MIKRKLNGHSHLRGLTLLEVLLSLGIVVVILICIIGYTQKVKQSNAVTLAKTQMNALLNAAIQYYTTYAQWPSSLNVLTPLLTGNTAKNPNFCSPWFGNTDCVPYTIAANTTYFALKVTTPSARYAQDLTKVLPNAYIDSDTRTVIAYTNAAVQHNYSTATPLGVLYASDSNSWTGSLTSANYGYCDTSSNGPYGIIDVNAAPSSFNSTTSCQTVNSPAIHYKTPECPSGSAVGMLLLPMGTPPPSDTYSNNSDYVIFVYLYNYLIYPPSGNGPSALASMTGTNAPAPIILSASDLVCLDPTAMSWAPNATPQ